MRSVDDNLKNLFVLAVQMAVNEPFANPDGSRNWKGEGPEMLELGPAAKTSAVVTARFAADDLPFPIESVDGPGQSPRSWQIADITPRQWRDHILSSARQFVRWYQVGDNSDTPEWLRSFFYRLAVPA